MEPELRKFLDWAAHKLQHLDLQKRRKVLNEMASYLTETQRKQNISYKTLIRSLGDRIQFINGFLLRLGEKTLPLPGRSLRTFVIALISLFTLGFLGSFLIYYYLSSLFDFDLGDGKLKLFGQIIDTKQMDLAYSTHSFAKKYVRKQSSTHPKTHFEIKLEDTKTTISYHAEPTYMIECEMLADQELSLAPQQNNLLIHLPGDSNCDLTFPRLSTFQANFKRGRMTVDRPSASFRIEGENGHITWIKNLKSRFKIFYDVQNAAIQGNFRDIFHPDSPQEAHLKLQNGLVSFIGP